MNREEKRARRTEIANYVQTHGCNSRAVEEAATRFSVSRKLVTESCRENGIEIESGQPAPAYGIIAALLYAKKTITDIANDFHVSVGRVAQIRDQCQRHGILK